MEHSEKVNSHSANQEILDVTWNLRVNLHFHKGLPLFLSWAR